MAVYLDHAATTPLHPDVVDVMLDVMKRVHGNPSSVHSFGREARALVTASRDAMAEKLGCAPEELVFTGSGSESDNLALFGVALAAAGDKPAGGSRGHVVTSQIEHPAVLNACRRLRELGFDVTQVPVDGHGRVDPDQVRGALRPDTVLISIMFGNNETGALQPVEEIGRIARERGIPFHVDAVQALGKVPIDLSRLPVDLMSFSAHKINGPKGVGLLYAAKTVRLVPSVYGGNQERRRRAGTENVPGIVGFAKALEIALADLEGVAARLSALRRQFVEALRDELGADAVIINGDPERTLPHIVNLSFPPISSESLLMNLDLAGIAASAGSACSSGSLQPSHVLTAMGIGEERVRSAIRFSFGLGNVHEDVTFSARTIATIVRRLRK